MQKVINALALFSFAVSACVVGAGAYVYNNQTEIKDRVVSGLSEAVEAQLNSLLFGGGPAAPDQDLPDPTRIDETGATPIPVIPFGG